jgi:hypothetical protein
MLRPQKKQLTQSENELRQYLPAAMRQRLEPVLDEFQMRRNELYSLVREGEMTLKFANTRVRELSEIVQSKIQDSLNDFRSQTSPLSDALVSAMKSKQVEESMPHAQKKMLDLLRANLVESQIMNRIKEFESRTYQRNSADQQPTPSVMKLMEMVQKARLDNDDSALEWARRQLEQLRPFVFSETLKDQIDLLTSRPGTVNRDLVEKYKLQIKNYWETPRVIQRFLERGIETRDANACLAVFEMARTNQENTPLELIESISKNMKSFPEFVLNYAAECDAIQKVQETEQLSQLETLASAYLDAGSDLGDVEVLTERELGMQRRIEALANSENPAPLGLVPDFQPEDQKLE